MTRNASGKEWNISRIWCVQSTSKWMEQLGLDLNAAIVHENIYYSRKHAENSEHICELFLPQSVVGGNNTLRILGNPS